MTSADSSDGAHRAFGRLWTRDYVLVLLINLTNVLVFYVLTSAVALYSVRELGASPAQAGIASGVFILGELLGRFVTGALLDRIGRRRALLAGLVFFGLLAFAYIPVRDLTLFIAVRVAHGIAYGIAGTAVGAAVQVLIPPPRRAEGTGWFATTNTLATAIGPMAAILMLGSGGAPLMFAVAGSLVAVAIVCALLARAPGDAPDPAARGTRLRGHHLVEPAALPMAVIIFLVGGIYLGVVTFLGPFAADVGLVEAAGWFFIAYAVAIVLVRPVVGPLQDRRGDNVVVIPALVVFAAGMVLLATASSTAHFLAAAAVIGAGYGVTMSATLAIAVAESPPQRVGLANSTYYLGLTGGMGVAPIVVGALVDVSGYRTTFLVLAGVLLAALVVYLGVHGRKRRGPHNRPHARRP